VAGIHPKTNEDTFLSHSDREWLFEVAFPLTIHCWTGLVFAKPLRDFVLIDMVIADDHQLKTTLHQNEKRKENG
jgi:hypothetical protein